MLFQIGKAASLIIIYFVFALLELAGNNYAEKMLMKFSWSMTAGMVIGSVAYSMVTALISKYMKFNMTWLMVGYGFEFAAVAMIFKLKWGDLPILSWKIFTPMRTPVFLIGCVAVLGFILSTYYTVVTAPEPDDVAAAQQ